VKNAVARARNAEAGASVKLVVVVRAARVHAYIAAIARRIERPAADSRLLLRNLRPYLTKELPGRTLLRVTAERAITNELKRNVRDVVELRTRPIAPTVTRKNYGPVIVIDRGSNRLLLCRGARYSRVVAVATGQCVYPTPLGRFQILVKWKDPWWYPPPEPWASGD